MYRPSVTKYHEIHTEQIIDQHRQIQFALTWITTFLLVFRVYMMFDILVQLGGWPLHKYPKQLYGAIELYCIDDNPIYGATWKTQRLLCLKGFFLVTIDLLGLNLVTHNAW